ncbi:hypothetical protein ACHAPN_003183 [Verticillium nonalfalfae]
MVVMARTTAGSTITTRAMVVALHRTSNILPKINTALAQAQALGVEAGRRWDGVVRWRDPQPLTLQEAPLSLLEAALLAPAEALQMVHRQEVVRSVLTRLEDSAAPFRFSLAISAGQILNKSQI